MTRQADNASPTGVRLMLVLIAWLLSAGGCEVTQVATTPLAPADALTGQLVRGTSTLADVERILGHPSGIGGSRLPPDWGSREVWFYQSIKVNGVHRSGDVLSADMTHHILLVFFSGGRYDGYMWYSNIGKVEAKTHEGIR